MAGACWMLKPMPNDEGGGLAELKAWLRYYILKKITVNHGGRIEPRYKELLRVLRERGVYAVPAQWPWDFDQSVSQGMIDGCAEPFWSDADKEKFLPTPEQRSAAPIWAKNRMRERTPLPTEYLPEHEMKPSGRESLWRHGCIWEKTTDGKWELMSTRFGEWKGKRCIAEKDPILQGAPKGWSGVG
jgi:hypothetical protein